MRVTGAHSRRRPAVLMMRASLFAAAGAGFTAAGTAQTIDPLVIPHVEAMDENNVDLVAGVGRFSHTGLTIGAEGSSLIYTARGNQNSHPFPSYWDNFRGGSATRGTYEPNNACTQGAPSGSMSVGWGESFQCFVPSGGGHAPEVPAAGGTLVRDGSGHFIYTTRAGDELTIDPNVSAPGLNGIATRVQFSDGRTWTYHYLKVQYYDSYGVLRWKGRLQSVSTNSGMQLRYSYASEDSGSSAWISAVRVTAVNTAYDHCDPLASTCSFSRSWPTASYSYGTGTMSITDAAGGVTRYTTDSRNRVTAVKPVNSANNVITYRHCNGPNEPVCFHADMSGTYHIYDKVVDAVKNGQSWTYLLTTGISDRYSEYKSTGPDTASRGWSYSANGVSYIEEIAHDGTRWFYEAGGTRVRAVRRPGLNETFYSYDSRLNVVQARQVAKPNTGLADIISTAGYDSSCANWKTCNKPNWTRDAKGNQTDYTYDPTHGGKLTETGPAVGGVRPQKRLSYAQRYAWVKDAWGSYVRAATPVWLLTQEAFCRTQATCAGTSDEVRTTYEYGPDSGPNNLFLRGKAITSQGVTLRTCYGYDAHGNKISETAPKAMLAACP